MNFNNILTSLGGIMLLSSLVTNYVLTTKLDNKKTELSLCEVSNTNLNKSLETQNKAIESLKVKSEQTDKRFKEISKKYSIIIEEEKILESKVKELTSKGLSRNEAICRANVEVIEGVVNEFFEKK